MDFKAKVEKKHGLKEPQISDYGDEGYVSNGNVEIISELRRGTADPKKRAKDETLETCALADEKIDEGRLDEERRSVPGRK